MLNEGRASIEALCQSNMKKFSQRWSFRDIIGRFKLWCLSVFVCEGDWN